MRAVRSVLGQTYPEIEVLVVDDSPADFPERDAVAEMVKASGLSSGRPLRYVPHETCRGACTARNTGIKESRGSIIGFLDDDDEWLPEKVEKMLPLFSDPEVALVYCHNIRVFDDTGKEEEIHRDFCGEKPYKELLKRNFIGSTSFPLLRKEALEKIGGFDEEMQSAQDADVWIRLLKEYKAALADVTAVRYHVHQGTQISTDAVKKIAGLERIYLKYKETIDADPEIYWIRAMKLIPFYLKAGQKKQAFRSWFSAVKACPHHIRANYRHLKKILSASQESE